MRSNLLLVLVILFAFIDTPMAELESASSEHQLKIEIEMIDEVNGVKDPSTRRQTTITLTPQNLAEFLAGGDIMQFVLANEFELETPEHKKAFRAAIVAAISQKVALVAQSNAKNSGAESADEMATPSDEIIRISKFIVELFRENHELSESIAWFSQVSAVNELVNQFAYLNNFSEEKGAENWFRQAKGLVMTGFRRLEEYSGYRPLWLNRPGTVLMYSEVNPEYFISFLRQLELYRLSKLFNLDPQVNDKLVEDFLYLSRQLVGVRKTVGGELFAAQLVTLLTIAIAFVPDQQELLEQVSRRLQEVSEDSVKMRKGLLSGLIGETVGGWIEDRYNEKSTSLFDKRIKGRVDEAQIILEELIPAVELFLSKTDDVELQSQASFSYQFALGFAISHLGLLPLRAGELVMSLLSVTEMTDNYRKNIEENLSRCLEACNVVFEGGNYVVVSGDKLVRGAIKSATPLATDLAKSLALDDIGTALLAPFSGSSEGDSGEAEQDTEEDEDKTAKIERKFSAFANFQNSSAAPSCHSVFFWTY